MLSCMKPYGSVEVEKHECVRHVQKCIMSPHLKTARTSFKHDKAAASAKAKELKERTRKEYGLDRG